MENLNPTTSRAYIQAQVLSNTKADMSDSERGESAQRWPVPGVFRNGSENERWPRLEGTRRPPDSDSLPCHWELKPGGVTITDRLEAQPLDSDLALMSTALADGYCSADESRGIQNTCADAWL